MTWIVEVPVAMYTSKTSFKTTEEWNAIPWRKLERKVFKLHSSHLQSLAAWRYQNSSSTSKNVVALLVSKVFSGSQGNTG